MSKNMSCCVPLDIPLVDSLLHNSGCVVSSLTHRSSIYFIRNRAYRRSCLRSRSLTRDACVLLDRCLFRPSAFLAGCQEGGKGVCSRHIITIMRNYNNYRFGKTLSFNLFFNFKCFNTVFTTPQRAKKVSQNPSNRA